MRLLSKREISQKQADQRKLLIDEGVKLARKVDALRETSAKEEANLVKFRTESILTVKQDIDQLTIEKQNLIQDINVLKEERKILQIPLDKEWEIINQKIKDIENFTNHLDARSLKLESQQLRNEETAKEIAVEKERIEDLKKRADEYIQSAIYHFDQSQIVELQAKNLLEDAERIVKVKSDEILNRETSIAIREREVKIRMDSIEKREIELNNRERSINDRYETLLRTESRLNINHNDNNVSNN